MPTVELRLSPHPAHVRTARLLAAVLARRRGLPESVMDEIKLAVGEACSRAVRLHERHASGAFVHVCIADETRFCVTVTDVAGGPPVSADLARVPEAAQGGDLVEGMALGLIHGLVEDVEVTATPAGTRVELRWPAPPPPAG